MKNLFKIVVGLIVISVLILSISSCKKDDDTGSSSDLIGAWQGKHIEGYTKINGVITDEWSDDGDDITFYSDYTCRGGYINHGSGHKMTWTYEKEYLNINCIDCKEILSAKVLKLTSSELIIEWSEKDGNEEYYEKATFTK